NSVATFLTDSVTAPPSSNFNCAASSRWARKRTSTALVNTWIDFFTVIVPLSGIYVLASGRIDHPRGKTFQEVLEAFHVLHWKSIFHIGAFEHSVETSQPDLASSFVDFKRNMPGSHPWRAVFLCVERRAAENGHEKFRGLLGGFLHVAREQRPKF